MASVSVFAVTLKLPSDAAGIKTTHLLLYNKSWSLYISNLELLTIKSQTSLWTKVAEDHDHHHKERDDERDQDMWSYKYRQRVV